MTTIIIETKQKDIDEHRKAQIENFLSQAKNIVKNSEFFQIKKFDNENTYYKRTTFGIKPENYLGSPCYNLNSKKEVEINEEFEKIVEKIKGIAFLTCLLNHEILITVY